MKVRYANINGDYCSPFKYFLRWKILCFLYSPIFYFIIFLRRLLSSVKKDFHYKVSLCLIFKDEGKYLKEWLDYHILIGVDHFYLYNNFSSDNYQEILNPYIKDGRVTLIEFPFQYAQVKAYQDCYERAKNETEWLGFIDTDEFINLQKDNNIGIFLDKYRNYPILYLNWLMFGTSGYLNEDYNILTIERYTQCWDYLCHIGKSFIHNTFPSFKLGIHTHRALLWKIPLMGITPVKSVCVSLHSFFNRGIDKIAFINHYWSRSYEYYIYKDFQKGDVDSEKNLEIKRRSGRFEEHELKNKTKNYSIQRWLVFLKKQER